MPAITTIGALGGAVVGGYPALFEQSRRAALDAAALISRQQTANRQLELQEAELRQRALLQQAASQQQTAMLLQQQMGERQAAREAEARQFGYQHLLNEQTARKEYTLQDRFDSRAREADVRKQFFGIFEAENKRVADMEAEGWAWSPGKQDVWRKAQRNMLSGLVAMAKNATTPDELAQVFEENWPIMQQLQPDIMPQKSTIADMHQRGTMLEDTERGSVLYMDPKTGAVKGRAFKGDMELRMEIEKAVLDKMQLISPYVVGDVTAPDPVAAKMQAMELAEAAYRRELYAKFGLDENGQRPTAARPPEPQAGEMEMGDVATPGVANQWPRQAQQEVQPQMPPAMLDELVPPGGVRPEYSEAIDLLDQISKRTRNKELSELSDRDRAAALSAMDVIYQAHGLSTGAGVDDPLEYNPAAKPKDMIVGRFYGPIKFPDGKRYIALWDGKQLLPVQEVQ